MDRAARDHGRLQRLTADSVATLAQLQDATSALEAARADLATARMNREYAVIMAPESGTVLVRTVTPGTTVAPGASMFVLGGSRRGRVLRAGLPDRDALRVQLGDSSMVSFDALPGRIFRGRVVLVGRAADPRTGTYSLEVSLDDADALPSGLVGRVRVQLRAGDVASSVPVEALLEGDDDSASVYTARRDPNGVLRATPARVKVVRLAGDRAVVTGVDEGILVVTRGAAYVTPGSPLREVTEQTLDSVAPLRRSAEHAPDAVAAAANRGRWP
jgi:RND family efflux transporter MFP subunit